MTARASRDPTSTLSTAPDHRSRSSRSQNACILLVQPDRDDREMYAEYLHHEGLSPICIADATHALRIAPRADVIVTGLLLPGGVDGFELIARLKRDVRTKHTPIVVLTASVWSSERERATAAGCDVFLSKPCLPDELVRAIRRMLASPQARRRKAWPELTRHDLAFKRR